MRARINVLSEIPARWIESLEKWHELNREHIQRVESRDVPGPNEEWLVYQTLLGVWPLDEAELDGLSGRVEAYAIKAAREAKMHTSWLEPDAAWEKALVRFIRTITNRKTAPKFMASFLPLQRDVAFWGAANALSQVVLKAMIPGVPDFYQGTELWDFSLVDPDNRRPVDYDARVAKLETLETEILSGELGALCEELMRTWQNGRIKLFTTRQLLELRKRHVALFRDGAYTPLGAKGARAANVVAFERRIGDARAVVIVPRLVAKLSSPKRFPIGESVWDDTAVTLDGKPDAPLRDIFTGRTFSTKALRIGKVLAEFPVAVLASDVVRR